MVSSNKDFVYADLPPGEEFGFGRPQPRERVQDERKITPPLADERERIEEDRQQQEQVEEGLAKGREIVEEDIRVITRRQEDLQAKFPTLEKDLAAHENLVKAIIAGQVGVTAATAEQINARGAELSRQVESFNTENATIARDIKAEAFDERIAKLEDRGGRLGRANEALNRRIEALNLKQTRVANLQADVVEKDQVDQIVAPPRDRFEAMLKAGDIPKGAKFAGTDKDANVLYMDKAAFDSLPPKAQAIFEKISSATQAGNIGKLFDVEGMTPAAKLQRYKKLGIVDPAAPSRDRFEAMLKAGDIPKGAKFAGTDKDANVLYMDKAAFDSLPPKAQAIFEKISSATQAGNIGKLFDVEEMTSEGKLERYKKLGIVDSDALYGGADNDGNPLLVVDRQGDIVKETSELKALIRARLRWEAAPDRGFFDAAAPGLGDRAQQREIQRILEAGEKAGILTQKERSVLALTRGQTDGDVMEAALFASPLPIVKAVRFVAESIFTKQSLALGLREGAALLAPVGVASKAFLNYAKRIGLEIAKREAGTLRVSVMTPDITRLVLEVNKAIVKQRAARDVAVAAEERQRAAALETAFAKSRARSLEGQAWTTPKVPTQATSKAFRQEIEAAAERRTKWLEELIKDSKQRAATERSIEKAQQLMQLNAADVVRLQGLMSLAYASQTSTRTFKVPSVVTGTQLQAQTITIGTTKATQLTGAKVGTAVAPAIKVGTATAPAIKVGAATAPAIKVGAAVAPAIKVGAAAAPAIKVGTATAPAIKVVPKTRPATRLTPSPTKGLRTGRATPRVAPFRVQGENTPAGRFPRRVEWPQGYALATRDLVTGLTSYRRNPEPRTRPSEGLKVVAYSGIKPKPQRLRLGAFDVRITARGLNYSRSTRQASPRRPALRGGRLQERSLR